MGWALPDPSVIKKMTWLDLLEGFSHLRFLPLDNPGLGHIDIKLAGTESPWTRVTDDCDPPCKCRQPNPGPLQKQQALFTAEPSLQYCFLFQRINLCKVIYSTEQGVLKRTHPNVEFTAAFASILSWQSQPALLVHNLPVYYKWNCRRDSHDWQGSLSVSNLCSTSRHQGWLDKLITFIVGPKLLSHE